MLAKKTYNDPKIRRSTAVLYKKKYRGTGTRYQVPTVPVLKKYRGIFVHGTAHLCDSMGTKLKIATGQAYRIECQQSHWSKRGKKSVDKTLKVGDCKVI